jgi:K+-transporting ATPase ATPase A chain
MQVGEAIFGGAGSGLYGIILLAMLTVFIAGLMAGRTPEYLGKKIEAREITLVMIATRSFDTATPMFATLLGATALIVTALTYVPADALGPVAEALALLHLHLF